MKRFVLGCGVAVMFGSFGCAGHQGVAARQAPPRVDAQEASNGHPFLGRKYLDPVLGFEIARPEGNWQLDANDEKTTEGVAVPVVLRHKETGAQVVIQIAPAVATPTQFAERLTSGLRSHPGFTSTDPEPLPLADGAVGFRFAMGQRVQGKVAVEEGGSGQVFMMMATWPSNAPAAVPSSIDEIFGSVHAVPKS